MTLTLLLFLCSQPGHSHEISGVSRRQHHGSRSGPAMASSSSSRQSRRPVPTFYGPDGQPQQQPPSEHPHEQYYEQQQHPHEQVRRKKTSVVSVYQ